MALADLTPKRPRVCFFSAVSASTGAAPLRPKSINIPDANYISRATFPKKTRLCAFYFPPTGGLARKAQSPRDPFKSGREGLSMVTETYACNRALENARQRISRMPIYRANRKAILAFSDFCFSEGLGARRVLKYLSILPRVARLLGKDFAKVERTSKGWSSESSNRHTPSGRSTTIALR